MRTQPTDNELKILEDLPRHPKDRDIAYGDIDPYVVAPFVYQRLLKAAIVSNPHTRKNIGKVTSDLQDTWRATSCHFTGDYYISNDLRITSNQGYLECGYKNGEIFPYAEVCILENEIQERLSYLP